MKRLIILTVVVLMGMPGQVWAQDPWTSWAFSQGQRGYGGYNYGGYGYGGYYGYDRDAGRAALAINGALRVIETVSDVDIQDRGMRVIEREQEFQHQQINRNRRRVQQQPQTSAPVTQTVTAQDPWTSWAFNPGQRGYQQPRKVIVEHRIIGDDSQAQNSDREKIQENEARIRGLKKNQQKLQKGQQQLFNSLRRKKAELLKKLKEGNTAERKEAIDGLTGFSYDDKVRKALEEILSDPNSDPELRKEVAVSFGKVKNKKALPALKEARVEDEAIEVRRAADEAIKKIN